MSLGARPLGERDVAAICDRKLADFRHKARQLRLVHVSRDAFLEAASRDPDLRFAVDSGFLTDLATELKDPVLIRVADGAVFTCPALALHVLSDEPPEIHRPFVEGAFLRKLFRLFVPAAFDGGESWEITHQVREIMQKHFAFQLIACETLLDQAS